MINKPYAVNVKNPLLNIIDRCQTENKSIKNQHLIKGQRSINKRERGGKLSKPGKSINNKSRFYKIRSNRSY